MRIQKRAAKNLELSTIGFYMLTWWWTMTATKHSADQKVPRKRRGCQQPRRKANEFCIIHPPIRFRQGEFFTLPPIQVLFSESVAISLFLNASKTLPLSRKGKEEWPWDFNAWTLCTRGAFSPACFQCVHFSTWNRNITLCHRCKFTRAKGRGRKLSFALELYFSPSAHIPGVLARTQRTLSRSGRIVNLGQTWQCVPGRYARPAFHAEASKRSRPRCKKMHSVLFQAQRLFSI